MTSEPPRIPARIAKLSNLAYNLGWSWDYKARALFSSLAPRQWTLARHNPVRLLRQLPEHVLDAAASDPSFLAVYDSVIESFERGLGRAESWFRREFPELSDRPIAYFSAEFGIHSSLPIYSGGLGILAGDHCKESSDLGIPLCAVGFAYPQGYFHQSIRSDGWQEDIYELLEREVAPIRSAGPEPRVPFIVKLQLDGGTIHVVVWKVNVGRVPLYLMDTDVDDNEAWDRELTARLYGGDREHRIRQEMVLGIGGVRALRALGIDPGAWHANEGHTAFMLLERIREFVQFGFSFPQALEAVRDTSIFTTHTPVAAGHDVFPFHMVEKHFEGYWDQLGLTRDQFLNLGAHGDVFNMTVLALRLSRHSNAVSQIHGRVSRHMWHPVWPDRAEERVPISAITNGVHAPTWIAPELDVLFRRYLGEDWVERHDEPDLWAGVDSIPDEEFWEVHLTLKRKLMSFVRERARARWSEDSIDPRQVLAMGTLLDPEALTIGFARRFTAYKRASLLFHDLDRIRTLMTDRWRPVQVIFAGKAHPADEHGKHLIQQIYSIAADSSLAGHVAFVENYDMHAARFFVQGVDVWMNNPRPPMEACGTSGQKAGMNGVLNLSVPDGWWFEGYRGDNGWRIGEPPSGVEPSYDDNRDAEALYATLENEVVPLFYERDGALPRRWIRMAKNSIRTIVPHFSARRMLKEYARRAYAPAAEAAAQRVAK